jgi:cysteine desulfurase
MKPNFQLRDVEVYMDNAATTAIDEEVVATMRPYLEERYGNPETVYRLGRESRKAVEDSRATIADVLKCTPEEIFFTSGGTEANNWAIKCHHNNNGKRNILYGAIEHSSVIEPIQWMVQSNAGNVSAREIRADKSGLIDLEYLETFLKDGNVGFVSIQYANNEIGTVQPVEKIAELCKKYGAVFHCDAVQAFGKIDFDVDDVGADMISLSAHKIHGPMGIGALYVKGALLEPLLHGGGQERGMRSGTLAVPEIVGFAKAAELAMAALPTQMPRLMRISEWLAEQLRLSSGGIRNGHPTQRLPNIVSITLPGIESEVVCGIMCSKYKSCLSAGSACSTTKRRSHVLEAIGRDSRDVLSTLRISLSRFNSDRDVMVAMGQIQAAVKQSKTRELI